MTTISQIQPFSDLLHGRLIDPTPIQTLRGLPILTTMYVDLSKVTDDPAPRTMRLMDPFWRQTWHAVKTDPENSAQMFSDMVWIEERLLAGSVPTACGLLFVVATGQNIHQCFELPYPTHNVLDFSTWPNLSQLKSMVDMAIVEKRQYLLHR